MTIQYQELCQRIFNEGVWVENSRTGTKCLTVLNETFIYDVGSEEFPLVTTRKAYWKSAIAELLGYLRGLDNAYDFKALGTPTWIANSENPVWLSNPNYTGKGSLGRIYGVQGYDFNGYNQYRKVYNNLKNGIDDRGEIISFWNPSDFDKGCLRPCMYLHNFSLLNGVLHLTSHQRSVDVPLGLVANQVQCYVLLALMAQVTGHSAGLVHHHMVNCHIYDSQTDIMFQQQLDRTPFSPPKLIINPRIKTWDDVLVATVDDFEVEGYEHHPSISYPFTV